MLVAGRPWDLTLDPRMRREDNGLRRLQMRLRSLPVAVLVLAVSACGAPDTRTGTSSTALADPSSVITTSSSSAPSTTSAAPSTTTLASEATSTTAPAPGSASTTTTNADGPPPFFRYGTHGVTVIADGTEIKLVDVAVASAWSDGAGGLLFSHHWLSEKAGIWRIPAGANRAGCGDSRIPRNVLSR